MIQKCKKIMHTKTSKISKTEIKMPPLKTMNIDNITAEMLKISRIITPPDHYIDTI